MPFLWLVFAFSLLMILDWLAWIELLSFFGWCFVDLEHKTWWISALIFIGKEASLWSAHFNFVLHPHPFQQILNRIRGALFSFRVNLMIFLCCVECIWLLIEFLSKQQVSNQTTSRTNEVGAATQRGVLKSHLVEPTTTDCPLDTYRENNTAKKEGEKNESLSGSALVKLHQCYWVTQTTLKHQSYLPSVGRVLLLKLKGISN